MKCFRLLSFMFVVVGLFSVVGCSKDKVTDPAPDPDPVTIITTSTMFVTADFKKYSTPSVYYKNSEAYVQIIYSGTGTLKDVVVTINGTNVPYSALQRIYTLSWDTNIVAGSTVKVDIASSQGNFSVSGVLPVADSGAVQISIPGCMQGSYLSLSNQTTSR